MTDKPHTNQIEHVEGRGGRAWEGKQLFEDAKLASDLEHSSSALDAIRNNPSAVFWSVFVSMTVVMEGYDTALLGNFYAYKQFAKKYGNFYPGVGYQLTPSWQAGLGDASGVGAILGGILNGFVSERYGHKRVLLVSLFFLTAFIFMTFFAPDVKVLLAGEILCGVPWGIFATIGPAYASEMVPLSLRVYLTSFTNMCFIIGQLIAAGVLEGLINNTTQWAYRIPFAIQWVWPAVLFPVLLFAPDSPWWLVRKGRLDDAEKSVLRLSSKATRANAKQTVALMVHTNNLEIELSAGTSYVQCFRGVDLRRTEIACISFAGQIFSGLQFAYSATYFFQQIGVSSGSSYKLNVGSTALALFGTLLSWFCVMPYVGRRMTYLVGIVAMTVILFIIGFLDLDSSNKQASTTQAALTLLWTLVFQLSVGQLGWAIPSEISSTRLRQKTVVIARNSYNIVGIVGGVLEPFMINPTAWGWRGKTGFFWGGGALLTSIWAYWRLPETKGRTFEELDILFAKRVPARKFKTYQVDAYSEENPIA